MIYVDTRYGRVMRHIEIKREVLKAVISGQWRIQEVGIIYPSSANPDIKIVINHSAEIQFYKPVLFFYIARR